jgi:type II secretory pathway component GspD/PulD (secretin)
MNPAFRTAIWSLGSGSLLLAAAAFSGDALRPRPPVAEIDVTSTDSDLGSPAEIAGDHFVAEIAPTSPASTPTAKSADADSDVTPSAPRSQIFQNASLDSAAKEIGTASAGKMPLVAMKPDERLVASHDQHLASDTKDKPERLITRIYRPITTSVSDLVRLIRPLLTPGIGTVVANRNAYSEADTDAGTAETLLVRDRPETLIQIDAIYADLEAAPKRIAIDAVLADIALPDSVAPGWRLRDSEFGVVKAEPRAVIESLRSMGSVTVIATNQLQILDRQWGQLEWTERSTAGASGHESTLRLATKIRIRPSVLANGVIRLEVHPTSTRLKEAGSPHPQMATVAFTTDVALRAGATALIAGSGDERIANPGSALASAKIVPDIYPQPSIRHETILLLMPRISSAD